MQFMEALELARQAGEIEIFIRRPDSDDEVVMNEAGEVSMTDVDVNFLQDNNWILWPVAYDGSIAMAEGWAIGDMGSDRVHIVRIDEAEVFENDIEAWKHVIRGAAEGGGLYRDALQELKSQSETAWREVYLVAQGMGVTI